MTAPTNVQCRCRGQCGSVHPMIGCPRPANAGAGGSKRKIGSHYEQMCKFCAADLDRRAKELPGIDYSPAPIKDDKDQVTMF